MTYAKLEAQINGLLAEADPLRSLDDDDPRTTELADIVNQINQLRAQQSNMTQAADLEALSAPKTEIVDRGALERRAADLGIVFRANISDAKLAERIEGARE